MFVAIGALRVNGHHTLKIVLKDGKLLEKLKLVLCIFRERKATEMEGGIRPFNRQSIHKSNRRDRVKIVMFSERLSATRCALDEG